MKTKHNKECNELFSMMGKDESRSCICKELGHTPTPWKGASGTSLDSIMAGNDRIALCDVTSLKGTSAQANAAFIIRAVNSHETLLKNLKLAVLRLEEFCEQQKKNRIDLTSDLDKAIAQVEGGQ